MPPRREKESGLPAVNSPVLFDYSEQLAILLFGQLMKWLCPLVRRGDSIPLAPRNSPRSPQDTIR
jgi:hypothetical protein